ncbi:MAG: EamA family transporter [Rhodospirillales bacterium]|nr:EamA family transporter [Rhodospirillales bacterium]
MSAREWLLLVTLSVVWGGSFFFIEVAVRELPPLTVALGRVAIAALALNAWGFARNGYMPGLPALPCWLGRRRRAALARMGLASSRCWRRRWCRRRAKAWAPSTHR